MPDDIVTVGLDLSLTSSGVCVKRGMVINIETIKTTPKTCENDLARLRYISNAVIQRIPQDVAMICVEDFFTPMGHTIGAAISLAMLGAIVRLSLYERAYKFFVVSPPQLKKWILTKGVGDKNLVIREVYKKFSISVSNDDEADSIVLAHIAGDLLVYPDIPADWPQYRKEVIKKIAQERPHYNC